MMDYWDDHGGGSGAWLGMGLMMLSVAALVALVVVLVVRAGARGQAPSASSLPSAQGPATSRDAGSGQEAERLLDERFARGEIDERDYLARRELLRGGR